MVQTITTEQLDLGLASSKEIMIAVGDLVAGDFVQRHFAEQEFDGEPWAKRYPNQDDPKINVAGSVGDFNRGNAQPASRRFQDTPVLGGSSGRFAGAIFAAGATEDSVEIDMRGENAQFAAVQQEGGETTTEINATGKKNLKKWLNSETGQPFQSKFAKVIKRTSATGEVFQAGDFTIADSLTTQVNERVFMDLSEEETVELAEAVELMFKGLPGGNSNG